jgi:hypothetical protein
MHDSVMVMRIMWWMPYLLGLLYVLHMPVLKVIMAGYAKYFNGGQYPKCVFLTKAWNLFLAVFSLAGAIRSIPILLHYALDQQGGGIGAMLCIAPERTFAKGAT